MEKQKILAVDDSHDILDVIKDMLSQYPYEIYTADNGAEALVKFDKFRPDIVTLDVAMPIMDGYQTLLKLQELNGHTKIIMLTALENEELLVRCLNNGASGYLVKPFTEEELLHNLTQVFSLSYDKYIAAFYYQVGKTLDNSIKKLVHPLASTTLNDVKLLRNPIPAPTSPLLDSSKVKAVQSQVQELRLEAPDGTIGYISPFNGQQEGMVASFIKEKNLKNLFDHSHNKGKSDSIDLEFFNIINMKLVSHLANSKKIKLYPQQIRLYDENKDRWVVPKDIAQADFEINIGGKIIPLQMQLWFDLG